MSHISFCATNSKELAAARELVESGKDAPLLPVPGNGVILSEGSFSSRPRFDSAYTFLYLSAVAIICQLARLLAGQYGSQAFGVERGEFVSMIPRWHTLSRDPFGDVCSRANPRLSTHILITSIMGGGAL